MKRRLLALVGESPKYGNGHLTRMHYLKQALAQKKILMDIVISSENRNDIPDQYCTILLDMRDSSFSENILTGRQKNRTFLIAIDNRGLGREQADLALDTLPHPEMNIHEFKQALAHLILPPFLTAQNNKTNIARIQRIFNSQGIYWGGDKNKAHICGESYIEYLKKQQIISTYFGQTLFEAIYLGKRIQLRDISRYHSCLSKWFLEKWKGLHSPKQYLDGQGLFRLSERIAAYAEK